MRLLENHPPSQPTFEVNISFEVSQQLVVLIVNHILSLVISVRSDSTPETSPEFNSRRVTKRRIHRSSAPAQLSSSTPVTSPTSLLTPATKSSESMETEPTELLRSVSMDFEPSVNQDTDLEIDGGGVEMESIDPGMVESIEVDEEEDVNGDVIRCLCNETEEGGFMIQVCI